MANLDLDPTGLWSLRKRVNQEISARFDVFSREIQRLVVREDAFGLVASAGESFLSNAASQRWRFLSSPQKLEAFQAWVKERVDAGLLLADSNVDPDKPWLSRHLQSAYMSGIGRSFSDAQAAKLNLPDQIKELNKAQFLAQSLTSPLTTDTLRLMYMRNFSQLKGVTEKMSAQMSVIMTEALSKGSGPAAFAARLRKEVGFSKKRAIVIARTELSYVQAEGQLDGYVNAGIGETIKLKVLVEWMTATNPCPMCSALKGVVFTIKQARGKIPAHPNCRCAWGPVNIYAPAPPGQKRSGAAIRKALGDALKSSTGKRTVAEARKVSKWPGADLRPKGKSQLPLPTGDNPSTAPFTPPSPKEKPPAPPAVKTSPKDPIRTVDKKAVTRVRDAGVSGVPMALPPKDFNSGAGIISTAKSADGPRTIIDVSLTPEGSRSVQKLLGSDFESERIKFRSKDVHPADPYFKRLDSTARMIESSKSSKDMNPIQIAAVRKDLVQLRAAATSGTAVEKEIASHYIAQMESVLASGSKKGDAVTVNPFRPARNPLAPTSRSPYPVSKVEARFPLRTLQAGAGVDSLRSQTIGGEAYHITMPGGVTAQFTPHTEASSSVATPLAGSLSVTVPGKPSEASIIAAVASLKLLELGTKPPKPAMEELEYLHRVIALRGDAKRKAYVAILRSPSTDAQKVTRVKAWIKTAYGIDLKQPSSQYLPQGRSVSSTGRGPRIWDRWDINPQDAAGQSDIVLQHVVAGGIPQALKKILDGGGDITSTVEKLRRGLTIPVNTVASDAPYVSLRIRAAKGTQNVSGLFFKPRSLTRTDAVSFNGSSTKTRETATPNITPADWASAAGIARNETRLQHGLSLLDEIDFIRVPTEQDRAASLKVFHDAGVTQLPDGRNVSDIVIVQGLKTPPVRSK